MPLKLDKYINRKIEEQHPQFSTSIDKYLKWSPFESILILDLAGIRTKSTWKKQILLAAASIAIRSLITDTLKKITHELRPGFSIKSNSFPSGHAAASFAGAEMMRIELKDAEPVLCYAGYAAAVTTGILRLYKNKHWLSDVVAGAAIGILSTRVVYSLLKKRKKILTRHS